MKLNIMSSIVAAFTATSARRVAFGFAPKLNTAARVVTARSMASSGPMPYDDDKMPIYAMGVNIGMQISQQVSVHSVMHVNAKFDLR